MLDKAKMGVEDKAIVPGVNGPGTIRCPKCGLLAYHCSSAPLPAACPDCGGPLEVLKPAAKGEGGR